MKKTLIILSIIFILSGCGAGNLHNPSISIAAVNNSCTNMQNNQTCTINVAFNNGTNGHPLLEYSLNPESSPSITKGYSNVDPRNPLYTPINNCQKVIYNTSNNTAGSCVVSFNYTSQGGTGTNSIFDLILNGIHSNSITITGN